MTSIAACCNFFNEANALPGWLESASQWADHITLYETGPQGEHSTDGSIEIAQKWGVDLKFGSIDEGFGVVRTKMVTMCPTTWVVILDADERIYRTAPRLFCRGNELYPQERYPEFVDMALSVETVGAYDQIALLKSQMRPEYDAIVTSRRHWQSWGHRSPSQNWQVIADWQARILRNCDHVRYRPNIAMHEQLYDSRTGQTPKWYQPEQEGQAVYFDHYHLAIKRMETEQRLHDVQIYNAIHEGRKPPTLAEFRQKEASA
jgi:hypothetical protein